MADETAELTRCAICEAPESNSALLSDCFDCGAWFHLNPYSDRPGIDCGDAVLGETLGVHFYCQRCIEIRESPFAGDDPARVRAEAMIAALHGDALGMPPRPPAPPRTAPPSARPGGPPAVARALRARRRYRRIDRE
ncbi:MAG: hypothetical protein O3B31_13830 [Chloroflexi bacterium]|nr:hypothetical protein [Chloroflexota bacterium]